MQAGSPRDGIEVDACPILACRNAVIAQLTFPLVWVELRRYRGSIQIGRPASIE